MPVLGLCPMKTLGSLGPSAHPLPGVVVLGGDPAGPLKEQHVWVPEESGVNSRAAPVFAHGPLTCLNVTPVRQQ